MTRIIAVALQKGGVGKTTTAQHLAHALARRGHLILLLDLDQQASLSARYDPRTFNGTLSDVLGTAKREGGKRLQKVITSTYQKGVYLLPADRELVDTNRLLASQRHGPFRLERLLRSEKLPFHYVILDTAPGISELLMLALVAADEVIVPVQLSAMGFEGFQAIDETIMEARELQELRGEVRLRYRAVLPTFYSQGELVSDGFLSALEQSEHPDYAGRPLPLAPMAVPETTAFEQAAVVQKHRARTIFEMSGSKDSPISRGQAAYQALAEFVDDYTGS